ncbi:putative cinnamoyl-CoA reductase [Xylariaceae sp. FL1272]|nr:putative cinnamoyl-CoA reductase [Xylariaceae sp. FL1272]
MSASTDKRIIVVLGATSAQGNGAVAALLNDPKEQWTIRAVTRDTSVPWAEQFRSKYRDSQDRVSLIAGDVYDKESLRPIFSGAYGIFALINELKPGMVSPEEIRHEVDAGRNIVDVAEQCGVQHFVMGSLPDMVKASSGRYTEMYHMDHKFEVEQYAKTKLDCVTCVLPGFFYNNLRWPQYCRLRADGVVRFCASIPGQKKTQWLDSGYDVGVFVARIFALGKAKTAGKNYPVLSAPVTMDSMAATFERITGRRAIHDPITHDEWADLTVERIGPVFREDVKQMMQWVVEAPDDKICWGALDPEDDISAKELGVTASTFEDWLKRTGWTGPTEVYHKPTV